MKTYNNIRSLPSLISLQRRLRTWSKNLLLCSILSITLSIIPYHTEAVEVPFSSGNVIDSAFLGVTAVITGDIDQDGDLDVIGAAYSGNEVSWWENDDGLGSSWTEHTVSSTFNGAASVFIADIDRDGDPDIAAAAYWKTTCSWFENSDGAGTSWTEHVLTSSFDGPWNIAGGDLDSDGDIDIVAAASWADEVRWWKNDDGKGSSWTSYTLASVNGPDFVIPVDMDEDGDLDIAASIEWENSIVWWENLDGSATSWDKHPVETNFNRPLAIHVNDIDNDGDWDIAGVAAHGDEVAWWENTNGTATSWTKHLVGEAFDRAWSVYTADVDADGDIDILGAANDDKMIAWWENKNSVGTSWKKHIIESNAAKAAFVYTDDIDCDGDLDVLGAAEDDHTVYWYENQTIHRSAVYPENSSVDDNYNDAKSIHLFDLDDDGDIDVLSASPEDGTLSWWSNQDTYGTSWSQNTITSTFQGAQLALVTDIDRDGDPDVVGAASTDKEINWWENDNGLATSWTERPVAQTIDAMCITIEDLNHDGAPDVIGAGGTDNTIGWWENSGSYGSVWSYHSIDSSFSGAQCVQTADVNRDDKLDVLGAASTDNEIAWWECMNASGTVWEKHSVDNSFTGACFLLTQDMNHDGKLDIVGAASTGDEIAWWRSDNTSGTAWTKQSVDTSIDGVCSIDVSDLDMDGDWDLAATGYDGNTIAWWENTNGAATSWTKHPLSTTFNGASAVAIADVDHDGDLDIFGTARLDDTIAWWDNRGGQFALPTTDTALSSLNQGLIDDVLKIVVTHNGRTGDTDIEFATCDIMFEESIGDPLTSAEANALFDNVSIYLDDGSGVFESGTDQLVTSVLSLSLSSTGTMAIAFTDNDPNVQVAYGTPKTYFVCAQLTSDAASQSPNTFRITHLTESSSGAEDRENDIPLLLQYAPDVASGVVTADTLPSVVSIARNDSTPTNAASVQFTVTFSEDVSGLDTNDFSINASGITGATATNVSGGPLSYTVTVTTGSGDGTLRLDLSDNDTVVDINNSPLGGSGTGNGDFTGGESYSIDKTGPVCTAPTDPGAYSASTNVTFNWTAGNDLGSNPSGIASYRLTVGTTPGGSDVYDANVGNVLSKSVTGADGQTLYSRVQAIDNAGNAGTFSGNSDGILIDTAAPTCSAPTDIGDTSPSADVTFNWAAGNDPGSNPSGIASYRLTVGTTPGGNNVYDANVGNVLSKTVTGENGQTLYAQIQAIDTAGNVGAFSSSSDGILIEVTSVNDWFEIQ